jgi:hypothetical protein
MSSMRKLTFDEPPEHFNLQDVAWSRVSARRFSSRTCSAIRPIALIADWLPIGQTSLDFVQARNHKSIVEVLYKGVILDSRPVGVGSTRLTRVGIPVIELRPGNPKAILAEFNDLSQVVSVAGIRYFGEHLLGFVIEMNLPLRSFV